MPAPMAPSPAKPTRSISLNIPTPQLARGVLDRLDDPQVGRAATEVARERLAELLVARVRVLADERLHRHEEARRAEAALEGVRLVESALKRMELAVRGQPLHGLERPAVRLHREHQARAHGLSVELDGARAADALLAADLRPRQPCLVPDEVGQERAWLDVPLIGAPVDLQAHPHVAVSSIARRARSPQSARRWSSSTSRVARTAASRASAPPASARSASSARAGTGPAPKRAIRTCPPGATTAAAPAVAKSPCVRACSAKPVPAPSGCAGTSISTSSSSGSRTVYSAPRKKSDAATDRAPFAERSSNRASSAISAAGSSAAGSACATDPPTVPRLRICVCPTRRTALCNSGHLPRTSSERSSATWRVIVPILSRPSSSRPESSSP